MAQFDLPVEQLTSYRSSTPEPDDFDDHWRSTLAEARQHQSLISLEPKATPLTEFTVADVRFGGFAGEPVAAWYTRPVSAGDRPLPLVIEYLGYGRGRGLPHERLHWPAAGYAHLLVDSRGQGGQYGDGGDTADPWPGSPGASGVLTRGIEDPQQHYYRRLVTDSVRALDVAAQLPGVDAGRVVVSGTSQGGLLALAAAGLGERVFATLANVPFLCDPARALLITESAPLAEVVTYLSVYRGREEQVMRTLSYVDGAAFARRGDSPLHIATALRDTICPPSTVFAAANGWAELAPSAASVKMELYPFNHHEGGGAHHSERQLNWLSALIAAEGER